MKKIVSAVLVCVLLVGAVFALASCAKPNSDPEKAKEALEDAGYYVVLNDEFTGDDDVAAYLTATKEGELAPSLYIIYYEESSDAKDDWDDNKDDIEEELEDNEDWVAKRSGKMIYYGHKDAVKAAA